MRCYSETGSLLIDDVLAERDIQREKQAENALREVASSLQKAQYQISDFQGDTAQALEEKTMELRNRALKLANELRELQSYTRRVVRQCHMIDAKNAQIIKSVGPISDIVKNMH